jgi:hypothetical protein
MLPGETEDTTMPKKKTIQKDAIATIGDARMALDTIAMHTVRRNLLVAKCDEMVAAARAAADEKYAATIAGHDAAIKAEIAALKAWSAKHEKTEFDGARSIATPTGAFGFRTGMPAVKFLRGWNTERVIEAILSFFPKRGWIRVVDELDKTAIITDSIKAAADLKQVGVEVKQGETFFVDINLEEATNRYAN